MSIRTYIFSILTGMVLLIAAGLSFQSAALFINSYSLVMEDMMEEIGQKYPQDDEVEQKILGFYITTDWQRVPLKVREHFPEIPIEKNTLHSKFVNWTYIAPPEKAYSLMVVTRDTGDVFVSGYNENIKEEFESKHEGEFFIDPMVVIILVGIAGILIFVFTLLFLFKKISGPVDSLQQWAKHLGIKDLSTPIPTFRFHELNALAKLIHNNISTVASSIEREQAFLSYASHELRTPIAVMRSNTALLERVSPDPSAKERLIRDRIQRASLTMKSMTETLLWLSREGEQAMPVEKASLGSLVNNMNTELQYLLTGKNVSVDIDTDDSEIELAVTPCIIVLNNLIRNAFQHTQCGHVQIYQRNNELTVINAESETINFEKVNEELGFGLGMKLVEKLTSQFGWAFETAQGEQGYRVTITFSS